MWKTQQWPQAWKRSVFIPIPKKGNAKECPNYHTIAFISEAAGSSTDELGALLTEDLGLAHFTLEAGKRWARLAQARAASRPGLCAIAPGRSPFPARRSL